jgi:hypothetical protein
VAWTTDRIIGHGVCIAYSFGDGHVAEADRKGNDEQIDCQEASRRIRRYLKVAGPEITGGREFQPHWRSPQEIQWWAGKACWLEVVLRPIADAGLDGAGRLSIEIELCHLNFF